MGELNNRTVGQLFDSRYKQAAADAAMVTARGATAENMAQARNYEIDALIKLRKEVRDSEMHPLLKRDKLAEIDGRIANAQQSRASATNSYASAGKTGLETKELGRRLQILEEMIATGADPKDMNLGALTYALGGGPAQDLQTSQVNRAAADQLETEKAGANFGGDKSTETSNRVDALRWNNQSPGTASFGFIVKDDTGFFDELFGRTDLESVRVDLPAGVTMDDVRVYATQKGVPVEDILKNIYMEVQGE